MIECFSVISLPIMHMTICITLGQPSGKPHNVQQTNERALPHQTSRTHGCTVLSQFAASSIQKAVDPINEMESGQAVEVLMSIPSFGAAVLAVIFSEAFDSASSANFRALRSSGCRHARILRRVTDC